MGACVSKFKTDDDIDDGSNHRAKFSGGSVHMITTKESWDEKLAEAEREDKVVIANFSATWCGPCKMLAPFYVELSTKHPSFMFLLIDVDELIDFSTTMDVNATPTLIFLKNGQPIDKLIGENRVELQKKILSIAESMPSTAK